jgi:hypothetical protein
MLYYWNRAYFLKNDVIPSLREYCQTSLIAYFINSSKEAVCALIAATSIIRLTISVSTSQKECKVVMILNEGELGGNKEIFNKYKEKLIDYEFSYDPKPSESLDILKDKLTAFKELLRNYLTEHKINNIRVIRRIINALNDFSFIQTDI